MYYVCTYRAGTGNRIGRCEQASRGTSRIDVRSRKEVGVA